MRKLKAAKKLKGRQIRPSTPEPRGVAQFREKNDPALDKRSKRQIR